jgi:hypothetical protein
MAPLPFIKIFAVIFKELSKPLAASIKSYAKAHPTFRGFALTTGRYHEYFSQHVEVLWASGGRARLKEVKPVPEQTALTVGADLMSQGFLLASALGLVWFEYARGNQAKEAEAREKAEREAAKAAIREARLLDIERQVADLAQRLQLAELRQEDAAARAFAGQRPPPRLA